MKVPPKRKGNGSTRAVANRGHVCLNESPSEKEGKFRRGDLYYESLKASMKVPPKRKGNILAVIANAANTRSLNESPSEKEGKSLDEGVRQIGFSGLNESPSEKEGK